MVDIDGSQLYRKQPKLLSEDMVTGRSTVLPMPPLVCWESINVANHKNMASMVSLSLRVKLCYYPWIH